MKYSKFPCAEHSDEPLKAEKETFHISFVRLCARLKNSIEQFKTKMI